jgi:phosphopantothenoylcysteine decarboxylase / phosphopantothenate---cysteine ligase
MGFALAKVFAEDGHNVILVSGPTSQEIYHPNIKLIHIESAAQMFEKCIRSFPACDCAVLSAAVADYTPVKKSTKKLKRTSKDLNIELTSTKDIAFELGKLKKKNQVLAGFALETDNEQENAKFKLKKKNLDFIVLNSLNDTGAGFNTDTNKVCIIDSDNKILEFPLKSKELVALDIRTKIYSYF